MLSLIDGMFGQAAFTSLLVPFMGGYYLGTVLFGVALWRVGVSGTPLEAGVKAL